MKFILFICLSLCSFYSFSDSCKQAFSDTKVDASTSKMETDASESNPQTKNFKLKMRIKTFNSNMKIYESNPQTKNFKLKVKTKKSNSNAEIKIPMSQISDIYSREKFQDKKYTLKYLKMINQASSIKKTIAIYPVLTGKEQIELVKIYREYEDERSLYILLFSNFRLIYKLARKKVRGHSYKFDDYFQESTVAFLKSVKTFDPYKGIQLSTYLVRAINNNLDGYGVRDDIFRIKNDFRHKLHVLNQEQQANPEMFSKDQEVWIKNTIKKHPKERFTKERVREILLHHFDENKKPIYEFPNASINKNKEEEQDFFVIDDHVDLKNYDEFNSTHSRRDINKIDEWMENHIQSRPNKKILQKIWEDRVFVFEKKKGLVEIGKEFDVSHAYVAMLEQELRKKVKEQFGSSKNFNLRGF